MNVDNVVNEPQAIREAITEVVRHVWTTTLERPDTSVDEDFFEIGGHSMLAARLAQQLRDRFEIDLSVRTLFDAPTLHELTLQVEDAVLGSLEGLSDAEARRLEAAPRSARAVGAAACQLVLPGRNDTRPTSESLDPRWTALGAAHRALLQRRLHRARDHTPSAPTIPRRPSDGRTPLGWFQETYWFIEQQEDSSSTYQMAVLVHLAGTLDRAALAAACDAVAERHDVMRLRFDVDDEGLTYQELDPRTRWEPFEIDVSGLGIDPDDPAVALAVERVIQNAYQAGFELGRPPLGRLLLIRRSATRFDFLMIFHHIIFDVFSMHLMVRDLAAFYNAARSGAPPRLLPLPIQFTDFAAWERDYLQDEVLEDLMTWWGETLDGGLPQLALKTDHPRPEVPTYRGRMPFVDLPADLLTALERRGRSEDVSLFVLLLTAFKLLLHRHSGQTDLMVGSPVATRAQPQTESLIGCLSNMIMLRTNCAGDPTLSDLVARVRETSYEAFARQEMPFLIVISNFAPAGFAFDRSPFQAVFSFHNTPEEEFEMAGLEARIGQEPDKGAADLDLAMSIHDLGESLRVLLRYDMDLFEAATIDRMLEEYMGFLRQLAADPTARMSVVAPAL